MTDHPTTATGPRLPDPPADLIVSRATWEDVPTVTALIAAVEQDRLGAPHTRPEDVRRRWLGLDDLGDTLLVRDTDDELLGYAEFHADHDPDARVPELFLDGRVAPWALGRGIATFLLARGDARARAIAHAAGSDRVLLETVVTDGDDRARAFFASRGFQPHRHLLDLRLDLDDDVPAPVWPDGIHPERFDRLDGDALRRVWEVHVRAFEDVPTHLPLDLEDFVASRMDDDPDHDLSLWLGASTDDGELIGVSIARLGAPGAAEAGWIRDLGVVAEHRRRGVAMAMLRTTLAAFAGRGCSAAQLEVDDVTMDGALELYRQAGMQVVRRTDLLSRMIDV